MKKGQYIQYLGKVGDDFNEFISYIEIIDIDYEKKIVKYFWDSLESFINATMEIDFENPEDLQSAFFMTTEMINRLKTGPVTIGNITQTYMGVEKIRVPIGVYSCHKIEWWTAVFTNVTVQVHGYVWIEENTGLKLKEEYEVPKELSANQESILVTTEAIDTNIIQENELKKEKESYGIPGFSYTSIILGLFGTLIILLITSKNTPHLRARAHIL
jgi:hypothetical protein